MSKGEIQYFLMFIAGIAVFWLSSYAVAYLPVIHSTNLANIEGLVATLAIYTLGLVLLLLLTLGRRRSPKAIVTPAIIVIILALAGAQLLVHAGHGRIHNMTDLGVLTFFSYILYGAFYVLGNTIAQRLARN